MRIENCFDSHVHWRATGDFAERVSLAHLKTPEEILSLPSPHAQPWVLGHAWQFAETDLKDCTRILLDKWCAEHPVALSRADGHALWVNTKALELSGLLKSNPFSEELCPLDIEGKPSGVLKEEARNEVLRVIPTPNPGVLSRQLMRAQKVFHDEGITHIRDVNMTESQWEAALHLEESGLLKLAVEAFVFEEGASHLELLRTVKKFQREKSRLLRLRGIKIFVDGSLGSETAALSVGYASGSGRGFLQKDKSQVKTILQDAWSENLEVAFHCIGDDAAHLVAEASVELVESGSKGKIHFEHVQILRDETIDLMKKLDCVCHLQPSHWLEDKEWLLGKIGKDLFAKAFPWRRLQEAEVPFFFGSDSPLSSPGVGRTIKAVEDAAFNGVSRLLGNAELYMSHPDLSWPSNTYSELTEEGKVQVVFSSETL